MLFNIHLYSNKIVYTRIKRYLILTVFYPKTSAHLSISLIISLKFSEISDFKTTIGELALASSLFVYRMGKNLLIFQVMAANY